MAKRELMDLCLNCTLPDCTGEEGCQEYRRLKAAGRNAAAKKPGISIEPAAPNRVGEQMLLLQCNAAINALEQLLSQESMNMALPMKTIGLCLNQLKEARSSAYIHLVNWDSIAQLITEDDQFGS